MIVSLLGCTFDGLDAWSDDFEGYADTADLLADEGGWYPQLTVDANALALTDERAHSGLYSVRFDAEATDTTVSKASLFVNDLALRAGTTVAVTAWYWLDEGEQPVLMDLEETVPIGAGPGIRLFLDADDRVWVERKKYLQDKIVQDGEGVPFPRQVWVELRLEVELRQAHTGTISVYQDGERIVDATDVKTLPTDWTYAIQGTSGRYTNTEFGLTAAGPTPARVYVDDVAVETLDR